MILKGSKTLENLMKAFAGESQARMRYDYYASVARKEGYRQIQAIFEETALNEKEHAKVFWKLIQKGNAEDMVDINASYPTVYGDTAKNLKAAAEGEKEEWGDLYPEFAQIAEEEGFPEVAEKFRRIADVEVEHEKRFRKLLKNIEDDKVFQKDEVVKWKCRNCGHVHEGKEAPDVCPSCDHPIDHFEVLSENY